MGTNGFNSTDYSKYEYILKAIADSILILGVIASIILFIVGMTKVKSYDRELGYSLWIICAYVLPLSVTSWGLLRVICNISNNLHEINMKLKQ